MNKKILFVDDEISILHAMKRAFRNERKEWDMRFVTSAQEALQLVSDNNFDAIVTDMRMPNMDGAELLKRLSKKHPKLFRVVLSGHSDEEKIIKASGFAHQYLAKPCDADFLKEILKRAFERKKFLGDGRIQAAVTGLNHLPSIPKIYNALLKALTSDEKSAIDIGKIISDDPAMTAKVLQLVNSAFFGLGRRITSAKEAAAIIGIDALKSLTLTVGIFSQYKPDGNLKNCYSPDYILNHSMKVALFSKKIAQFKGVEKGILDEYFLAGMLHDIGILVLIQNFSKRYSQILKDIAKSGQPLYAAEMAEFGACHEEIGAYILGLWGIPDVVVEAVAFHHAPSKSSNNKFSPLSAVHIADAFCSQAYVLSHSGEQHKYHNLDKTYLNKLGLLSKIAGWKQLLCK